MNERFADTSHVVESLRNHTEASDEDEGRVTIFESDARIVAADDAEMDERNLWSAIDRIEDGICTVRWTRNSFGGVRFRLHFHQKSVDATFELNPADPRAIGARQATDPTELGDDLRNALLPLEDHGATFTFSGVDAASMADGGHFTDFEFEYVIDGLHL